ncbi:hypothetical protein GRI89_16345 [Altererythrobacter salegens]|uniref:Uncharacterized protein n=1 Tax=Croceibacterium salegens TaxID=1737568 RepID=A0A6I4SYD0_9SPHN|nr:hypothetical protein [Croceibacterium salegens]MXO61114.1 hypothetical protein [Croceibacterium salegens]
MDQPSEPTLEERVARLESAGASRGTTLFDKVVRYLPILAVSNLLMSAPAFLISIGVAYFTFVQADATEKMQVASVWPRMAYDTGNLTDDGAPEISLNIGNQGVGPAHIEGMEISYAGKPYVDADSLVRACCAQGKDRLSLVTSRVNGMVIRPGEDKAFVRLTSDADPEVFAKFDQERLRIRVKLCYCSVFDDCWIADSQQVEIEPVKQCPADWTQYEIPRTALPKR